MNRDWFTVEALDAQTFAISEYGHWEETHCYLLCGTRGALLIDTGLGVADIRGVVAGLTKLPVLAAATHVHWDHIAGWGRLRTPPCMRRKWTGWMDISRCRFPW